MSAVITASFYRFVAIDDVSAARDAIADICRRCGVLGTVLVAGEGINGTIAGTRQQVNDVLCALRADERFAGLEHKEAPADGQPFRYLRVRIKQEIVTLGVEGLDPATDAGTYVAPEDWNELIRDPDVVVIDTRNDYEVDIGHFAGAVNPHTRCFRDLPAWLDGADQLAGKPKVAMYCTGGIRCEKSTALLRSQGFDDVYHLRGGILKYLETIPVEESLWQGECFVFDERVAVGHGLEPGHYELCRGCRYPIDEDDKASPDFVEGVCCPHCHDKLSAAQKSRFAERQKQVELAEARNDTHLGPRPPSVASGPVLYSFRRCPYAMRARLALLSGATQVRLREVVLRDKPDELLAASRKATVPVLQFGDGRMIDESLEIMLFALRRADPDGWLTPMHGNFEQMMALIDACDGDFKAHLDRYKYATRYEGAEPLAERAAAAVYVDTLEARLAESKFLFGARPSLADAAIFPFVRQFAGADPAWFDAAPWPRVQAWLAGMTGSAAFATIMKKYPQWRRGQAEVPFPPPGAVTTLLSAARAVTGDSR